MVKCNRGFLIRHRTEAAGTKAQGHQGAERLEQVRLLGNQETPEGNQYNDLVILQT